MKFLITIITLFVFSVFANAQKINGKNLNELEAKTIRIELMGAFRAKRVTIDYGQRIRGNRTKVVYDDNNKRPFTFNSESHVMNWCEENGYVFDRKDTKIGFGNIVHNWYVFKKK